MAVVVLATTHQQRRHPQCNSPRHAHRPTPKPPLSPRPRHAKLPSRRHSSRKQRSDSLSRQHFVGNACAKHTVEPRTGGTNVVRTSAFVCIATRMTPAAIPEQHRHHCGAYLWDRLRIDSRASSSRSVLSINTGAGDFSHNEMLLNIAKYTGPPAVNLLPRRVRGCLQACRNRRIRLPEQLHEGRPTCGKAPTTSWAIPSRTMEAIDITATDSANGARSRRRHV